MSGGLIVNFRGHSFQLAVDATNATIEQLCRALQQTIPGLAPHTLKLLLSKPRSHTLQLDKQPDMLLTDVGESMLAGATAGRVVSGMHMHGTACGIT